ncbi:MAG: SppA protein [bacterium]|nr:SppA protein [bacterium]
MDPDAGGEETPNEGLDAESPVAEEKDFLLYSGHIHADNVLEFMEFVAKEQQSDKAMLILCTYGGDAGAAYKIGRYLQVQYESLKLLVPGYCKSAGTLLAIAADEIVFSPFGELGPLDVQMTRTDDIAGMESGLNISEAFLSLEQRAHNVFHGLIGDIIRNSGGIVSFRTASHSASEVVAALYGPIFGQIEPEDVGSRARAMRIGEDYGERLNTRFKNLRPGSLKQLSQRYSSHRFVIDMQEAAELFDNVREASPIEKKLVRELGSNCREPSDDLRLENVTNVYKDVSDDYSEEDTDE